MVLSIQYKDESSKFNRGRDKSRLGLRNWRKNEQYKNRIVRFFFFEIFDKPDFWTPFIRESVANLIFRFSSHSILVYLMWCPFVLTNRLNKFYLEKK